MKARFSLLDRRRPLIRVHLKNYRPADRLPCASVPVRSASAQGKLVVGIVALAGGIWAYWPTATELVETWSREPDYSHGFAVAPLALFFCWLRRRTFPGLNASGPVLGMALLLFSLAMRFAGARYFLSAMDGWSILPWTAAVVAILGGWPLVRWCFPSIGFLFFMVPLPFRVENELSASLQQLAAKLSTTTLQLFGQPAFSEGNVILLGDQRLEVARACSGLRLFMGSLALAYACVTIVSNPRWEKVLLITAAVPIAIISNSARIVGTGLLYQLTDSQWIRRAVHNLAGLGMFVLTACLFGLLLWYLSKLFHEEEIVDMAALVRKTAIRTKLPGRKPAK